jgi:DNA invertase Pin-like site-specific DNA recombinase
MRETQASTSEVKRGAVYIRESTREQDKGFSPEKQRDAAYDYAKKNNIKVVGVYKDLMSGTTAERPQFQRMLADALQKKFDVVIVYHTSRFARNRVDASSLKKQLRKNGVEFVSVSQPNVGDPDRPETQLSEGMQELFDEHQSNVISFWVRSGLGQKRKEGYMLGNPPLGYYKKKGNPDDWFVDEKEKQVVLEMFELYASGNHSLADTAILLNKRGYAAKTGNPFMYSGLPSILKNRAYLGMSPSADPEIPEVKGRHEAIVTVELFNKVQSVFEARRGRLGRPPAPHRFYLLQGMIFCHRCRKQSKDAPVKPNGVKLTPSMHASASVSKSGAERHHYTCKFYKENKSCKQKPVLCKVIDDQVLAYLGSMQMPEDVVDMVSENIAEMFDGTKNVMGGQHLDKVAALQRRLEKLKNMFLHDDNMPEEKYRADADQIKAEIKELEQIEVAPSVLSLNREQMIEASREFVRKIPKMIAERSLSDDELQGWIRQVIKRVWVKGDKVVEIEPHDEYKRLFAAIRKVYNQPPPSPHGLKFDRQSPSTGRFDIFATSLRNIHHPPSTPKIRDQKITLSGQTFLEP